MLARAIAVTIALSAGAAAAAAPVPPPVAAVVEGRFPLGSGVLPIYLSQDWARPLPAIRRVAIVVHGYERNADEYARIVMGLDPPADTLVVAPQFLAAEDIAVHHLPDSILRWQREHWADGDPADGPTRLSAFDALDALLARASDRSILPNVARVVLAGFSAGGQLVQRYAETGGGEETIGPSGIAVRYVVGSPSSYAYFASERPQPTAECAAFDHWKYGFAGALPPYVAAAASHGLAALERRYAMRTVIYLAGTNDTNPNHRFLDKSCAAEAQGPARLARMTAFFAAMRQRDGDILRQRVWIVAGAAHNAQKVFGSACGRAALLDSTGCPEDPGAEEKK